jgi:hypothetical protein
VDAPRDFLRTKVLIMSSTVLSITPDLKIPEFLTKEIGAKLAYVDDTIFDAKVSADLDGIVLHLAEEPSKAKREYLIEKANLVVSSLVKGAFEPHLRVVVDKTDREFSYREDPMDTLAQMREVVIEGHGYYILGPMMSGLLAYFEEQYLSVAVEMGARPYRFPALISPAYLEKVKYFSNFPHSLSFVTQSPLERIEACDSNRIPDNGRFQRIAPIAARPYYSVDSPEDIALVEGALPADPLSGKY